MDRGIIIAKYLKIDYNRIENRIGIFYEKTKFFTYDCCVFILI